MKFNRLGVSAAVLTFASLAVAGVEAPANANPTGRTADSVEVAQRVGERPGDVCRRVNGANVLHTAPDMDSDEIANMIDGEQVHMIRNAFVGTDGNMWFELEDSVGNVGYMTAQARMFPGGPLESTLVYCDGVMTFPVTW
ncbi:MAG: hypothetical protein J7641_00440 [Cyanobacteria bacterium SID2]|nr:hypothetical protein [Cyanobacteria bacterium SID2]MBP0003674.1 hypothetical protein [Cyanobacteria bacterium SBC]